MRKKYPFVTSWTAISLVLLFSSLNLFAGCTAQYPLNPKVGEIKRPQLQRNALISPDRSDSLVLILAFSGGGTRAAALSYGILEALARIEIPIKRQDAESAGNKHTLLDEVTLISSVSGGSFTAAYYGLHGKRIFTDFRDRFLLHDHQWTLLWGLMNPMNWVRLWSPKFGRSDIAQEYYDIVLFNKTTLGDISAGSGPIIMILATDAIDGQTFSFTPGQFALICSDYETFPVSRAVAASAAFPGVFTPVILRNYAGECDTKIPSWMPQALKAPDWTSRNYHMAKRISSYLDSETKPYIHLFDGGVSDNLGLRSIVESIAVRGGIRDSLKEAGLEKTRRMAFIIVDAQTNERPRWRLLDEVPGLAAILGASSTIMINKYNFETIDLLHRYIQEWSAQDLASGQKPIDFYTVHVAFDYLSSKEDQEYFHKIPTNLYLPAEQVDKLREVAGRILYNQESFRKLVRDIGGNLPELKK